MSVVVEIQVDATGARVADIHGVEHLRAALSKTGKSYDVGGLKLAVASIAKYLCNHQARFFTRGLHGLAPTTTAFIQREHPHLADVFVDNVTFTVYGQELPASLFFQPSVDAAPIMNGRSPRAHTHVQISVLDALARAPFATDATLAATVSGEFPSVNAATITRIRDELGIPSTLRRGDPSELLSGAIDRLAPTEWLRVLLRDRLRFDTLAGTRAPWPEWWRSSTAETPPDTVVVDFGDASFRVRLSALESAQSQWAKFGSLIEGVDDPGQRNALAELVARRVPAEDIDDARRILNAFVRCGRWPEKRDPKTGPLHPKEIVEMLRVCPESEWTEMMPSIIERGLTTKTDSRVDEGDVWIDTLALLMTEGV